MASLELTKEEAISLSMAFRNQVSNFKLRFSSVDSDAVARAGAEYFHELGILQNKLEKFISEFE